MRENCFIAFSKDSYTWVEGDLVHEVDCPDTLYIITKDGAYHRIIATSVGQFVGKQDMRGNKIFENDFVKFEGKKMQVVWDCGMCGYMFVSDQHASISEPFNRISYDKIVVLPREVPSAYLQQSQI